VESDNAKPFVAEIHLRNAPSQNPVQRRGLSYFHRHDHVPQRYVPDIARTKRCKYSHGGSAWDLGAKGALIVGVLNFFHRFALAKFHEGAIKRLHVGCRADLQQQPALVTVENGRALQTICIGEGYLIKQHILIVEALEGTTGSKRVYDINFDDSTAVVHRHEEIDHTPHMGKQS
jgi:hypothetical protein